MAEPHHSIVIVSFFLALSFSVAFSSSKRDYPGLKSLQFTLYGQDILNKTDYLIVKNSGVAKTQYSAPFGSVFASHDPLTISPNNPSKVVGSIEGISMISTLDGLQSISALKVRLSLKKHKGSISVIGAVPNVVPGDMTVAGGTGDFMFVQGYLTFTPIDLTFPTSIDKIDFHLYWPPYGTY